jgi:hypothetical protein
VKCQGCGIDFIPDHKARRYCTKDCQVRHNNARAGQRRSERKQTGGRCTVCDAPAEHFHACAQCGDGQMCDDCASDLKRHYCKYAVPLRRKRHPHGQAPKIGSTKNPGFKAKVELANWLHDVTERNS